MTNREKYLESLSDEKLAKMIFQTGSCKTCPVGMGSCRQSSFVNCENQLQCWLKQEVLSEGQGWQGERMTITRNIIKTYVIEDAIEFGQTIGSCKERRQLLFKSKKDPLLCECFICSHPFKDEDYPWIAFVKGNKNVFVCKRCGQQIQREHEKGD